MANLSKIEFLSDCQMTDYVFSDLDAEQDKLVEAYLRENEKAFALSLELLLLVLEKGYSKEELLNFLRNLREVDLEVYG